jgi:hypothetical protein
LTCASPGSIPYYKKEKKEEEELKQKAGTEKQLWGAV